MSRSGERAFKQCNVKVIEFGRRVAVYPPQNPGSLDASERIILDEEDVSPEQRQRSSVRGYNATLHCPRTQDDERVRIESTKRSHHSQLEALKSVSKLAGELLCEDCMFSGMDPVAVSEQRQKLAKAEIERLETYQHLSAARAELQQVEAAHFGPLPQLPSSEATTT